MAADLSPRQPLVHLTSLAALVAVLLALYAPFLTTGLRSCNDAGDSYSYHVVVADALAQCRAGVFPVYVGQSPWRYNGGRYPQLQAPLLTTSACALDRLTLRRLPAAAVLNLLLLTAVLASAFGMYRALVEIGRDARAAGVLALAFASCPGVLGLTFRLDMIMSVLALTFLPWIWLALWRVWQGATWRAALLLGASLALTLMGHPPIALWAVVAVAAVALVGAIVTRRGLAALSLAAVFALLAAAWPLVVAFQLGGARAAKVGVGDSLWQRIDPAVAQGIAESVRNELPGALLPVGWVRSIHGNNLPPYGPAFMRAAPGDESWTTYLQLGYVLWTVLLLCGWRAWRTRDARLHALLAGVVCTCAFLFPIPFVTPALWAALPRFFDITRLWPAQRLYPILASLVAVAGAAAWAGVRPSLSARARQRVALLAALGVVWLLHEAWKFTHFAWERPLDRSVERVENAMLRIADLQMSAPRRVLPYSDPAFPVRVLGRSGARHYDNGAAVASRCARADALPASGMEPVRLVLQPGQRVGVCVESDSEAMLTAIGPGFRRTGPTGPGRVTVLPLFTYAAAPQDVALALAERELAGPGAPLSWNGRTLRSVVYSWDELPVRLRSVFPYRAQFDAPRAGERLETSRQCVPGYRARNNGNDVDVDCSDDGYVTVPLVAGKNDVELEYVAPGAVRVSFWLTVLTLGMTVVASLRRRPPASAREVRIAT